MTLSLYKGKIPHKDIAIVSANVEVDVGKVLPIDVCQTWRGNPRVGDNIRIWRPAGMSWTTGKFRKGKGERNGRSRSYVEITLTRAV